MSVFVKLHTHHINVDQIVYLEEVGDALHSAETRVHFANGSNLFVTYPASDVREKIKSELDNAAEE